MSLGLTRKMLMVAGRLLVLAYLVCVLSPGVALALGDGVAPCFDETVVAVAATHHDAAHHEMILAAMPQVETAHAHHHDHPVADAGMQAPAPAPSHHDHSKMPGPCCAMMCAVGLAAALPAVTLPASFAATSVTPRDEGLPGRTPPRLYRPPIVLV
ncbi:hypothetical protein [Bradyrhizobium sp. SZCCHNRI20481]|uniref:hypothetical protein n=1 Tax=Bradyrhizobium sp. SZCCHNRI20481 TaxID=3057286 RepID=UPI002916C68B|nr:hypothetical protein [Bradyrhizobium sp. SZCCHNRI20481]